MASHIYDSPAGSLTFADYASAWQDIYSHHHSSPILAWRDGWLENGFCQDCRYCCGPQASDEPFPMALLPHQLRPGLDQDFYLLDARTACLDQRGCKSCGPQGCRLHRDRRPVACGLFPLVVANGGLYLYKTCPAVLLKNLADWLTIAGDAAKWLTNGLNKEELGQIALDLPLGSMASGYIDLAIPLDYPGA